VLTPLVTLLKADAVPMSTLQERYGGLLALVRTLIGVVPNSDPYLEIWPPAFRTYNVMVPNFLNLPLLVWGMGAPRDVLGLAMYASSRAAGCDYCSAHTCSFALRRGVELEKVMKATGDDLAGYTRAERAAVTMARGLSTVPATFTASKRKSLEEHLSRLDAEAMVLGVAMMGFLNKVMNALGVELEGSTVEEVRDVIGPTGWTPGIHGDGGAALHGKAPSADGVMTRLGVVRHAPNALSLDGEWTAGVPHGWPEAGAYLSERTGHDFPVLSRLLHRRAVRALATMLRDNLDPATSVIGVPRKLAAGIVYAQAVGNESIEGQLRKVGAKLGAPESDPQVDALARAIAPSPCVVDEGVVESCRAMAPKAIVEVVTFVAVMQLLYRLETYYAA
jgi:hypothetical protein